MLLDPLIFLEAENISLTPPRGNSKSPGREKSPKGERELTRKSSHKRRELSHSSSAPNCERPSSLVVKKAISLSGENSKEVSAEKSQDSPSSSAREKMKDNSSSRIVREVKIKRSSENLTSLLSGLTGLQQETVLLFKLSEDEQRNLDDEVEEAMKEILSGCENVFDVKK